MNKNKALSNLIKANGKICAYLHTIANFDWQAEFFAAEFTDKFTYKSLIKQITEITGGSIDNYNIFLLYKPALKEFSWRNEKLHIAEVCTDGIMCLKEDIRGGRYSMYHYDIDTVYSKGDFEKIRKDTNTHYWLIIQAEALENHHTPIYENDERYKVGEFSTRDSKGKTYIYEYTVKPLHKNYAYKSISPNKSGNMVYNNVEAAARYSILDKSGYRVDLIREEYARKVKKIKAERSAAAAAVWDNTEKCTEIEARIRKIMARIAELTAAPVHEIPYRKIERCYTNLWWTDSHLKALYKKEYSSMESIKRNIAYIEDYLTKAENELDKEETI